MQRSPHDIPDSSDLLKEWCLAVPWSIVPTGKSTKALTYFGGGACCTAFEPEFIFRASLAWRCSQRLIGPGRHFRSQRDGLPCAFPENPWGFSPGGVSNLSGSVDFPKCYAALAIHPLCLRIGHGHPSGILAGGFFNSDTLSPKCSYQNPFLVLSRGIHVAKLSYS